jgi:CheY-like chemotaxis protein
VLVADADPALFGLLEEWLAACGCTLAAASARSMPPGGFDLILVDVPFPRRDGPQAVRTIAGAHPGTPIVVLSSNFFPGVEASGAVARALGVAAVLPKPLTREALLAAVGALCAAPG